MGGVARGGPPAHHTPDGSLAASVTPSLEKVLKETPNRVSDLVRCTMPSVPCKNDNEHLQTYAQDMDEKNEDTFLFRKIIPVSLMMEMTNHLCSQHQEKIAEERRDQPTERRRPCTLGSL